MKLRRKKQGKVIIYPHAHAFRLYPEERIKQELKRVDIINLEHSSKERKIRDTLKWNLLSKTGIDLINERKESELHKGYYRSLKKNYKKNW